MKITLDSLAEDPVFDVVVVGAGGAGMAAALFAAIGGQSALLIESTGYVGGTTALSAATTWIPNTHHAASVNPNDTAGKAADFLRNTVGNYAAEDLRAAFLALGPEAIAVIEQNSEVQYRPFEKHPDYIQEAENATLAGRPIEPLPFDGRKLGADLDMIRPPIPEFTVLGGMMIDRNDVPHLLNITKSGQSFVHAMKLIGRHAIDRLTHSRGTRLVMGNALIGRLLFSLNQHQVPILLETKVESLIEDGQGVTGVIISQGTARRQVTARRAVIMATGGFGRSPQKRRAMLPEPTPDFSPTAPGHTGAMHDLALGVGARYGENGLDAAFWAPVSVRKRADGTTAVFPHFVLDRGKPGTVVVNQAGQRFVNESESYHRFGLAMFEANKTTPCIPAYLVTDATGLAKFGMGMVRPDTGTRGLRPFLDDGYLTAAPTLEELAQKLGVPPAGLNATIQRMNEYAITGVDREFNRGSTPYQRHNGDATHAPNPTLGPIKTAPFYAIRLYPGDIGTSRGLVTDTNAQVLDGEGRPIKGLYACGNDMNSIMGGVYPAPGITLGPALVFAYAATRHAAGVP